MNEQEKNEFLSINENFFTCPKCNEKCECTFYCGEHKYLMKTNIDRRSKVCDIKIYVFDDDIQGKLDYSEILPMNGDMIPIPEDYNLCIDPSHHCGCY